MVDLDEAIELVNLDYTVTKGNYDSYDGVLVKTNKQSIELLISNRQSCCESWGYLTTNDCKDDFIGAKVLSITVTDSALSSKDIEELEKDSQCAMTFYTIKTDRGDLQFTAYNSHNGYYSHEVRIISNQLNDTEYL